MKEYCFTATFTVVAKDEETAFKYAYGHDFDFDDLEIVDDYPVDNADEINDERKVL